MLKIFQVTAFSDNYIWVISDGSNAWVVDPGDAAPVIRFLNESALKLEGILLTHWHGDHQGGVEELCDQNRDLEIIGSHKVLKGPSSAVSENDAVNVLGAMFKVLEVPGHTLDHVAFISTSELFETPVAFTGDTMFAAGGGRLFEGTSDDMFCSLNKINDFPENTLIYCGHEYTLANLKYAVHAEPKNPDILNRLNEVTVMRDQGISTIPTTLALERLTNPFLRATNSAELGQRRLEKDKF
ncbi:MAG: hydroxyacylglutathione hydrolase [Gammaproteobacteria bacterium]|nr:hydroxyacylglutathione hydrolase [Gammaproteobacteria bacterium]